MKQSFTVIIKVSSTELRKYRESNWKLGIAADCPDPSCSGHGACVAGKCYCKAGWQGERCNQVDQRVYQCLPGCSEHGTYDLESAACICEEHWTGIDCSQPSCGLDCGPHGTCKQGVCKSVHSLQLRKNESYLSFIIVP